MYMTSEQLSIDDDAMIPQGEKPPLVDVANPTIMIGASGFSYDDWVGPVYPAGMKKGDMLHYYAEALKFSMVELNFSYSTQPTAATCQGLIDKTPDSFEFVIKLHQDMTHNIRDERGDFIRNDGAVDDFLRGIEPLITSDRLICALAQFPLKFKREDQAQEHIAWLAKRFDGVPLVVEVRHESFGTQSFFEFLSSLNVGYCVADGPDTAKLPKFTPVATSNIGYFRFHGRNRNWFGVPPEVRYDYRYDEGELRSLIGPVTTVSKKARRTLAFFNNHYRGSAITNATRFRELVGGR
jgi:uncharacterized protein YecE (DUF72 family)